MTGRQASPGRGREGGGPTFRPASLKGLAPAGRLDIDSTGLLVLTQDGRVAKQLIGDDSNIEKEYLVRVTGRLDAVVSAGRLDDIAAVLDQALRERLDPAAAGVWADLEGHLVRRAGNSSLDELVSVYGRSARTFERACRRETGYAPSEYRALVRCDLARSALCALQSPDLSALAHAVGFCDLPHFCHTFKRWSGITPLGFHRFCEPFRRLLGGSEALRLHEERSREILD